MLSFECIKNEKSVYFLLTSAEYICIRLFCQLFLGNLSKIDCSDVLII